MTMQDECYGSVVTTRPQPYSWDGASVAYLIPNRSGAVRAVLAHSIDSQHSAQRQAEQIQVVGFVRSVPPTSYHKQPASLGPPIRSIQNRFLVICSSDLLQLGIGYLIANVNL